MSGYPIRTARLTVRLMRSSDVDTLCAYRDETEVAAMQDWAMPYVAGMAGWLSGQDRLDDIASGGRTHLAIDLGGEHVGEVALLLDDTGRQASIGCTLSSRHWSHGYAREAALAVMADLVDRLGVVRITATTDPSNIASLRLLEAIGLVHEHEARLGLVRRGERTDATCYAVTADGWRVWRDRPQGPPGEVSLVPIDSDTAWAWRAVEGHWSQRRFVAGVDDSYTDALFPDIWRGGRLVPVLLGVMADGERVGFLMYADRSPSMPTPYLWRMLVDRRHQRRGIGRQALRLLARRLLAEGNTHMTTTFAEGRGGPREFYLGLGGRLTGEIVDDETEAVIDLTTLAAEPVEP